MTDVRDGLLYSDKHMWVRVEGKKVVFGLTDHAQKELGDVVFVELPKIGSHIESGDEIGALESVKTIEPLYTPVSGKVTRINDKLPDMPDEINKYPYDEGWVAYVDLDEVSQLDSLMTSQAYRDFIGPMEQ
jgi:glycine cleavage system H protein